MERFKSILEALGDVILKASAKENATPEELTALAEVANVFLEYLKFLPSLRVLEKSQD